MILAIDTTGDKKRVALFWPKSIEAKAEWQNNQIDPLEKIDFLLRKYKVKKNQIKLIVVNRGPGSFTGIRIGVTLANSLGYSLRIPVIGISCQNLPIFKQAKIGYRNRAKAKSAPIVPIYGREPHISQSKVSGKI